WTSDPSQGSWNLLSDWQRHRRFALSGNDATGAHPIPYGFYAQAIDDYGRVPSESELRFEHFGAWAMGYTMTDDFMYNSADGYSVTNTGTKNGARPGDVLLSWFKVLDESLDGTDFSNEKYFAVTNALVDPTGSAADCHQQIKLNFDLTSTNITTLQRLSRDTG